MIDSVVLNTDAKKIKAFKYQLPFINYVWRQSDPYVEGLHTTQICETIDNALDDYKAGKDVFLIIKVPFRHGKTEIISKHLPPRFLGMFPEREVQVATYSQDYVNSLSRFARELIRSEQYNNLYNDIRMNPDSYKVQDWQIQRNNGTEWIDAGAAHWSGIGGSITGKGYHLGIIDDYLKNRQDAESETIREKQWDWFTNVFLTRRAPVSITIILATPWHTDDIIGRIGQKMKEDPDFPRFKTITFPAFDEKYESGTLFPERYSKEWYSGQRASLGIYGTASLMQCNPQMRGGNMLNVGNVQTVDEFPEGLKFVRAWDLASTEKQLVKSDPDYTVGALVAIDWTGENGMTGKVPVIYIKDVRRIRKTAPERDNLMKTTAVHDGSGVRMGIESVGGYIDTYNNIKLALDGVIHVEYITVSKDKVVRASALEPAFDASNVYILRAEWNTQFLDELGKFPSGVHDDQVDALVGAFEMLKYDYDFGGAMVEAGTRKKEK